jgi:hypothetical protein
MAARTDVRVRCSYCGGRTAGTAVLEVDLRGIRYDYCDAACATAHRQAVELFAVLCTDCGDEVVGDTGCCTEHLDCAEHTEVETPPAWRRAG